MPAREVAALSVEQLRATLQRINNPPAALSTASTAWREEEMRSILSEYRRVESRDAVAPLERAPALFE